MKYLKTHKEKCVGCHTCENVCSQMFFKVEDPERSCIRVLEEGGAYDLTVCNQCGRCIEICPTMALSRNPQGVVMLNKTKCIGCLACVSICPTQVFRYNKNDLNPFKCIACGGCAAKCPTEALEIIKEV